MSPARIAVLIFLVCATGAGADEQEVPGAGATDLVAESGRHGTWSASLDAYLYLQEEDDFLMPILAADRAGRDPREARAGGTSRTSADDAGKSAADGALWAWPTSLLP